MQVTAKHFVGEDAFLIVEAIVRLLRKEMLLPQDGVEVTYDDEGVFFEDRNSTDRWSVCWWEADTIELSKTIKGLSESLEVNLASCEVTITYEVSAKMPQSHPMAFSGLIK